jgi:hypothetical protein
MKSPRPKLYAVIAWIVTLALSLSPVMAQNAQEQVEVSKDNSNPIVDTSVLPELPLATTATAFPAVARDSTLPSAAAPIPTNPTNPSSTDVSPGGKTKWIILATIIITAAVVGTILLLRGFGGGDDKPHPPSPPGTIITAGPPSVSAPSH